MPTRYLLLVFHIFKISMISAFQPYYYNEDIICLTPNGCISGIQKLIYEEYLTSRSDTVAPLSGPAAFGENFNIKPEEETQGSESENENPSCYVQTCEQLIMGRNLRYQEALRIIQNEEYLEAADFDMVLNRKKKRRKKRDFASIQTSTKPIKETQAITVSKDEFELSVPDAITKIKDRLKDWDGFSMLSVSIAVLMVFMMLGSMLLSNPVLPLVDGDLIPPGNPKPGSPDGVGNRPETSPDSVLSLTPFGFVPVATFPHFATSRTFAAEAVIFSEIQNIQKFAEMSGAKSSPFDIKPPVKRRKDQKLNTNQVDTNPYSCHPSSHSNSLCKIFENKSKENQIQFEKERLAEFSEHKKISSNRMDRARVPRRRISKRGKNEKSLMKTFKCLQSNIMAKLKSDGAIGEMRYLTQQPYDNSYDQEIGYSDQNDNAVNSIDDCIDGIEEPLYGFRVNIKLVEDESCIMGQTCKGTPNDIGEGPSFHRRSGDQFFSEGPPQCKVRSDPLLSNCQ